MLGATSSCVPSRNENEICAGNTPGICKPGLYCKLDVNKCVKVGANGADCNLSGSDGCASGFSCVYEKSWLSTVFRCRTTPTTEGAKCVDRCGNLAGTLPAVPLNCRR